MHCLNEKFSEKFNFAYNYFSELLSLVKDKKRKFPQALIFEGADTKGQYLFSLELARILNCEKEGAKDCDCVNCKWIRGFSHPAAQNVSQIHFKGENDETKTVISAAQAKRIETSLALSSDYHRFFIFFSSKEKTCEENELTDFSALNYSTDINFEIAPLNYSAFTAATPNALLKSIEEPPEKTTFIFLTKSKEDILPTIVSRCLTFKLSGTCNNENKLQNSNLFNLYPSLSFDNCLDMSDNILFYIKENELTLIEVLDSFLEYLLALLKENISNPSITAKINNDISIISNAQKQSKASMSDKIVLESLMLRLARGY